QIRSDSGADGHSPDERRRLRMALCRAHALPCGVFRRPSTRETIHVQSCLFPSPSLFLLCAAGGVLMFTGIIEGVGRIAAREAVGGDARLTIEVGSLPFDAVALGESIAV